MYHKITIMKKLFMLLLLCNITYLHAQTGPGGVGNPTGAGGQPRNILWLRADVGTTPATNGLGVSAWNDQSGNANHFSQATVGNRPVFTTGVVNGRPVLRFTSASSHFISASGTGLNTASAVPFTFFAVTNSNATQTNPKGLFDSAPGSGNVFRFYNDGSGGGNVPPAGADNSVEFWANNPALGGYTLNASAPSIVTTLGDFNGANRRLTAFKDGTQIRTGTGNNAGVIFAAPQFGRINGGDYFSGDIAEAIIFNGVALNAAQRLVVENHLGAKYGRSLGANDYFSDVNTNGATGFNRDVIGILGLNTGEKQVSSSNGFITISENANTLSTVGTPIGTFMGHNNSPIAQQTNNMGGTGLTYNAGRDFWLESIGFHSYTITFDFAALGYTTCPPSGNPNDYRYIIRPTQSNDYTTLGAIPTIDGTKVTFNHTTGGGSIFINIGYNATVTVPATTVYSVNTTCPGGCNWENSASWTTNASGVPSVTPFICTTTNRVVLTGHTVTVNTNGATSPSVTINTGGRLNLGATTGHTFTTLAGSGTLSLASNTYPTVTTNTHISTAGSTIEFTGATSYTVPAPPNAAAAFRNLVITGGGSSTKTLVGNQTVNETLNIGNLTSLEVAANNLTVVGATNIDGSLIDNNATGTTSLQNVTMNGGVIDGAPGIGVFTISGTLNFATGTNTIGRGTITVAGATTIPAGVTVNFTSIDGNKTFTGATTITGNWNNAASEEFFFGNNFTLNSTASFTAGTACNYTFQGTGTIGGTMATYTLPIMRVTGTYTNNVPQLFVTGEIFILPGAKLTNAAGIVPPYFIGFNNTRPACWRMDATSVSNNAGNEFRNSINNGGNNFWANRNGAGNIYTVRHTDIQTNATPTTAQAIMVQFGIGTWTNGGAATGVATISVGSGGNFADNANVPAAANTTAALTVNFEGGNSLSLSAGATNLGNANWHDYVWVINPTGAAITYQIPNSNVSATVAAGTMDVWRGWPTLVADDVAITNTGVTPTDFKFVFNGGTGVINMYNLKINPITTPIIGAIATAYCTSLTTASATFNVPFSLPVSVSADSHFNTGNTVLVQLSDAAGSFANPRVIGSLVTTATSGSIACAIPANTQGTGFRMRIVTRESMNMQSGFTGADNGTNIIVNGYRTLPTLPQTLAINQTGATLSIVSLGGSPAPTAYQWAYRIGGSTTVFNIAGATTPTYTPAPPLTATSNTYQVFCILTSACGSSFSDPIQISVNCGITADLAINGAFSNLPPIAYSGTSPAGHVSTGWGFSTQYGNPTTGVEAPATVDCNGGGGATIPCSMYPETTYAVGFSPADYHTNFCNNATTRSTNVNSAPGSAVITRTGTVEVQAGTLNIVRGTGTNFQADLVGSVIYVGAAPNSQRSLITAVNVGTQQITVSPAYTAAFAAGSDYRYMHGSKVIGGSGGYCLVGNGATGGSINIWQQTLNVTPYTNYVLTFNAINLNGGALAFATFFNCFQTGANVDNPGVEACNWATYSVQWNSGNSTTVNMAIRNIGLAAGGNDITVDDIRFYQCTDPVTYPTGQEYVWKGFTNDWFNGDNWGACVPPTCGDDVVIPVVPVGRFYPVINAAGATTRDIQLDANASLTINATFNLDVCGHFNNQGNTIFDPTSTVTFVSDTRNPQLVTGTWTGANRFANLVVNKATAAAVLRFDTDINILRSFTITTGTVNGNSRLISVGRDFTNGVNGTFNANNSTVTFNGGNAANNGSINQIFTNSAAPTSCQFFNATINQSSTSTVFLNNDFIVNNVLTLTRGKFVRSGAAGPRYVNVTNNASASIVGHNTNSYIATIPFTMDRLILRRAMANLALTYDFPVGDANNYQNSRLEITSALGAGVTTMDAFFTTNDAAGTLGAGCTYVPCSGGYWSITPNTPVIATALYNMELFPVAFSCAPATSCVTQVITIAKGTFPTTWAFAGSSYTATYKRSGFNSFTDFVPMGGITILPVNLLRFEAKAVGNVADLTWTTTSELNNKEFLIEKTIDGVNFVNVGTVKGGGTKNSITEYSFRDTKPNKGVNYYRLKQIDFDGKYTYSKIEAVKFESDKLGTLAIYPNPVDNNMLTIEMPFDRNEQVLVSITDMLGKVLYEKTISYNGTSHIITSSFPTGVYLVTVIAETQTFREKVVYQQK